MLEWIRLKFGTAVIGGIITLLALVFVFYGVFTPKSTRGLHDGAVAGTVNGDSISISEFNREYNRRIEFYKSFGKFGEDQLKAFHLKEGVFNDLVRRKLMLQEAQKIGLEPADEEVRDHIREIPSFQKDGKFDLLTYKRVLEANNYTPGTFERVVRDDLSQQRMQMYLKDRVHVSDEELKREYEMQGDKRKIKYVLLSLEVVRKGIKIEPAAIAQFLKDPAKLNLAKSQYESKKDTTFKGQSFDQVKESIAHEVLASEKTDEARKLSDQLAEQCLALLKADSASDAKINSLLKPYGVEVKNTGWVSRAQTFVPGIGEDKQLMADSFGKKSPIDPAQGGKAKKYTSPMGALVALVQETQTADLAKLDSEREKLIEQISYRKERGLMDAIMQKLVANSKIERNPSVIGDENG